MRWCSLIVTWGSLIVIRCTVNVTWGRLTVTRVSLTVTSFILTVTWCSLTVTQSSLTVTWGSLTVTWGRLTMTWGSITGTCGNLIVIRVYDTFTSSLVFIFCVYGLRQRHLTKFCIVVCSSFYMSSSDFLPLRFLATFFTFFYQLSSLFSIVFFSFLCKTEPYTSCLPLEPVLQKSPFLLSLARI